MNSMNRMKIYNYRDLRRLGETFLYPALKNGVVVTATGMMMQELSAYYPDLTVLDIHELLRSLAEEWQTDFKHLGNFIRFREEIETYTSDPSRHVSANDARVLKRNAADMWNSIELLVEAGVHPEDIPYTAESAVPHFRELWKIMEKKNRAIRAFRHLFEDGSLSGGEFDRRMLRVEEGLNERLAAEGILRSPEDRRALLDPDHASFRTFFFLGFYYITPIQQRIIEILSKEGYPVRFLNCYDPDRPYFFEIWKKTYRSAYRDDCPEEERPIDLQPDLHRQQIFADTLLCGRSDTPAASSPDLSFIRVCRHSSALTFAEEVIGAAKRGEQIFTADARRTGDILREYYPEAYGDRHFLSYPMGQYIRGLHDMWDSTENRMQLSFDTVFRCFASGWLEDGECSGQSLLTELKSLQLFFSDCTDIQDWKQRMALLKTQLKEVRRLDHMNYPASEGEPDRFHRMMINSYNNYSFYHLDPKTLNRILHLIDILILDGQALFGSSGTVRLDKHFDTLKDILRRRGSSARIAPAEQELAAELILRMEEMTSGFMECHLNSLKDAVVMLIGDHTDETYVDPDLRQTKNTILPLTFADTAILREYGQDVHLLMADEFSLPGRPGTLPWPIHGNLIRDILRRLPQNHYIRQMCSIAADAPLLNRYLCYTLFDSVTEKTHPDIHISWLDIDEDRTVGPSPYIRLMGLTPGKTPSGPSDNTAGNARLHPESDLSGEDPGNDFLRMAEDFLRQETGSDPSEESPVSSGILSGDSGAAPHFQGFPEILRDAASLSGMTDEPLPQEVLLDHALCPMRAFYSYVLNEMPGYQSDFQVGFALTAQIRAHPEIRYRLRKQFPFQKDVERQQISDFAYKKIRRIQDPADFTRLGRQYPGKRLDIHFLKHDIRTQALAAYESAQNGQKLTPEKKRKQLRDRQQQLCTYCPYHHICLEQYADPYEEV